ncbi:Alpha-1A adrenergic receptor [Trichoplax sp. H2]|nr:Alpha-1A adrenergic receptor [Trichoplax sp. H2]|eukprot:RDD40141.1 Alpha-1A adrenergic receptor [Trichoplax sp. H2]
MNTFNSTNLFPPNFRQIYRYAAAFFIPTHITGLILNILILKLLFTDKTFQKTTYRLIRISVISDTISASTAVIMFIMITFGNLDFVAGSNLCRIGITILYTSYTVSMMNLALIAVDRYFIVVRPFSPFYRIHKRRFLITTEILIWLISISATSPMLLYVSSYPDFPTTCDFPEMGVNESVYVLHWSFISYVMPTATIVMSYAKVAIYQKNYVRPGIRTSEQLYEDFTKRRKFIKVLIYITSCYILLSLPYFVCCVIASITQKSLIRLLPGNIYLFIVNYFINGLVLSIHFLNPLIYVTFDKQIRAGIISEVKKLFHSSM